MKYISIASIAVACMSNWAMAAKQANNVAILEGTCVDLHDSSRPTASLECVEQLQKEKSEVFKVYRAVPNTVDGQFKGYVMINSNAKAGQPIRLLQTLRTEKEKEISAKEGFEQQK